MKGLVILLIALTGDLGPTEYSRILGEKKLDQATLDSEGYGEKKSFKREADGLRITLGPGEQETGWRTPPQLRFGGDFTVSATFAIKKLPKPAQEDGAAIGLAIAFGDINQPEVTLVRLIEPTGADVYRSIEKANPNPGQMPDQMAMRGRRVMVMGQPAGKPVKPPRRTFPAAGDVVRMEIQREGSTIRLQIVDARSARPRYLGQVTLGQNDVAAVKLFASNRNGAEAVNVLLRDFTIHAGHINGLGTIVRTVFDEVIYSDPTSIENSVLTVGLSLPTGDIDKEFETMGMRFHDPYDMQLGSGTFDLKPALTYNALSDDAKWNWGAQSMYIYHIGKNDNHYSLGDSFKVTSWLQRALGPVTSWVRLAFNTTGRIDGQDPEIQKLLDPMMGAPTPDADPRNYGGQRLDGAIGLSLTKGPFSLGVEGGIPFYQNLNGLQLKTSWFLTAAFQVMF